MIFEEERKSEREKKKKELLNTKCMFGFSLDLYGEVNSV